MLRSAFISADWLSTERIRRIAIIYGLVQLAAIAVELWLHLGPERLGLVNWPIGEDFTNFWSASRLAFHGDAKSIYNLAQFLQFEQEHTRPFSQFRWYAYPPVTFLLTGPLAFLSYLPAYFFWIISGTALVAFLFSRSLGWPFALLAAVAMPATFFNIVAGQGGQFTAVIMAGGILLIDRQPVLSGVLFGMLCGKPQLGVLIPFALLAGRRWLCLSSAILTAAILAGMTTLLFGPDVWKDYLSVAPLNRLILEQGHLPDLGLGAHPEGVFWHRMPTVFAASRLIGLAPGPAYFAQAVSAAVALVMTLAVWRSNAATKVKGATLIVGTFLATPYAWDYDLVVLCFAVVWLWLDARQTEFLPGEKFVLAMTMAMTLFFGGVAHFTLVQVAPLFLWATFIFAARRALGFHIRVWQQKLA